MTTALRPRTLVLFLGDLLFFGLSLWFSLFVRTFEIPSQSFFLIHLLPFSLLFAVWIVVYFIAGLYESRSIILARRALSGALLIAQTMNMVFAALFFFFLPIFGVAPKTLLFIYLVVSFLLVLFWRVVLFPWLGLQKTEAAIAIGEGEELQELVEALNAAHRAPVKVVATIVPSQEGVHEIRQAIQDTGARIIIADFNDPRVGGSFSNLYNFWAQGVRFFDSATLYEEVFGRVPLSHVDDRWIARNIQHYSYPFYDTIKRIMDIAIALPAGIVSLIFYPFIMLAQKIQDGGVIFYTQKRVGEHNAPFVMVKFRSMSGVDQGSEVLKSKYVVTPVGRVMRKTRIDELPQLWNVLKGEMSLIGPRPEFPAMVEEYGKDIPYYNLRHMVKPGLSGWAQLYHDNHPHHGSDTEATREKLSYDLYYLKHRSLWLDAVIVLKTIKKLLTRSGV